MSNLSYVRAKYGKVYHVVEGTVRAQSTALCGFTPNGGVRSHWANQHKVSDHSEYTIGAHCAECQNEVEYRDR